VASSGHSHCESTHISAAWHAFAQLPHAVGSTCKSMQASPQSVRGGWQRGWQLPSTHRASGAQAFPHAPQWSGETRTSVHAPLHVRAGAVHSHASPAHVAGGRHGKSHAPQLSGLVFRSTHRRPQSCRPAGQPVLPHAPSTQTSPGPQDAAHAPQFAASVAMSVHCPAHFISGATQSLALGAASSLLGATFPHPSAPSSAPTRAHRQIVRPGRSRSHAHPVIQGSRVDEPERSGRSFDRRLRHPGVVLAAQLRGSEKAEICA
jgi:hypothetical protein